MGHNQIYSLLHGKVNQKQNRRQPIEWEKMFANDVTDNRSISKICKQLIQLNRKKTTK